MRRTIATLAFGAIANAAIAQTVSNGADFFSRLADEIDTRSLTNCDPEFDVPELSAKRKDLLSLPNERAKASSLTETVSAAGMTNLGQYAACFDKRLENSTDLAVIYHSKARIIALNPKTPDLELAVHLSYKNIRATWVGIQNGDLPPETAEKPAGIRTSTEPAAAPPATAPHRDPAYR